MNPLTDSAFSNILSMIKQLGEKLIPTAQATNPAKTDLNYSQGTPISFTGKNGYAGLSQSEGGSGWYNPMNVATQTNANYQGGTPAEYYTALYNQQTPAGAQPGPIMDSNNFLNILTSRLNSNPNYGVLLKYANGQHYVYDPALKGFSPPLANFTPNYYDVKNGADTVFSVKRASAINPKWQVQFHKALGKNGDSFMNWYTPTLVIDAQGNKQLDYDVDPNIMPYSP